MWSQTGNHPQEDLAKFGYRPDVKVEKIQNLSYIFGTCLEPVAELWQFKILEQIKAKSFTKILSMC
jgi:hypothetical protein